MSDGPSKVVPEAEPLDDIILGDDDATTDRPPAPPVVKAKSSSPPPIRPSGRPDRASAPPPSPTPSAPPTQKQTSSSSRLKIAPEAGNDTKESQGRKRAKMTLRIPDDEVSRPQIPATTPVGGIPAIGSVASLRSSTGEGGEVTPEPPFMQSFTGPPPPNRSPSSFAGDDGLELQDATRAHLLALTGDSALRPAPTPAIGVPAIGVDPTSDPGWTPFQPPVEERDPIVPTQPMPVAEVQAEDPHGSRDGTMLDHHEVGNSSPSQPPVSEEIPVDMDLSEIPASDEMATHPRLPFTDSEEIKVEEVDRVSETGEVEVAPEDLVSVESLPSPAYQPPPVKLGGKPVSKPEAAVPTATSLMQGVAPPAAASRPGIVAVPPVATAPAAEVMTQAVGQAHPAHPPHPSSPTQPAAHPAPTPGPSNAVTASAASGTSNSVAAVGLSPTVNAVSMQGTPPGGVPAAKQPSNPLIFVPPVGALAPPPMTDTALHRKKVRPWWEELFNDDFIRTMAKVTDVQIGKEVNFIEESLGCEAGAMILDLACGTGRHAVELAARGYQVVGFDLSLAMLARASDEAQDRKQKINFVQGDMREMTFEETFDGVYSWNTSFGYFDEEKNGAVIARVHKALKKGGQFLLDVVNRDYIVRQAPSLAWFEGDGCICMDEMTIDFITSRMKVKRTLMMDDGRTKEIEYSIRTYALHELGKMLHDNGFRVAEVSGRTGTPGVFFGCESPRTLILAEKR